MRELIHLFAKIFKQLMLQNKTLKHIEGRLTHMATREDLGAKIAELQTKVAEDIAQVALLVQKALELIERINTGGTPADFAAEVASLQAAIDTLTSDNPAIQAAIDAAIPPTPQP